VNITECREAYNHLYPMWVAGLFTDQECTEDAIETALSALQSRIPRVIKKQEIENLAPFISWVELYTRDKKSDLLPCAIHSVEYDYAYSSVDGNEGYPLYEYGAEYRFWIGGKPTDEQMKETKWEEHQ
jgi:hypothetical protein